MTPEERQILADLFERIRGSAANPRDPQAEAFINDAVRALPFAPYVLAQTVLVQQHALEGASQRIAELEAQARSATQQPPQDTSFLGSLGRTIFGGPSAPPPPQQAPRGYDASAYQRGPAPAPQGYPPQPQPGGPWGAPPQAQGGGFLSSALQTATGVAGGMIAANALEGLLGGRGGMFGGSGLSGAGFGGLGGGAPREEIINNYYGTSADQHAQDVQQDADQDQDDAQDAGYDDGGGFDDGGSYDT